MTSTMAKTIILPVALRYQGEVAEDVNAVKAAGVDNAAQMELLKTLTSTISELQKASPRSTRLCIITATATRSVTPSTCAIMC